LQSVIEHKGGMSAVAKEENSSECQSEEAKPHMNDAGHNIGD
jgi:hypothetical protein